MMQEVIKNEYFAERNFEIPEDCESLEKRCYLGGPKNVQYLLCFFIFTNNSSWQNSKFCFFRIYDSLYIGYFNGIEKNRFTSCEELQLQGIKTFSKDCILGLVKNQRTISDSIKEFKKSVQSSQDFVNYYEDKGKEFKSMKEQQEEKQKQDEEKQKQQKLLQEKQTKEQEQQEQQKQKEQKAKQERKEWIKHLKCWVLVALL